MGGGGGKVGGGGGKGKVGGGRGRWRGREGGSEKIGVTRKVTEREEERMGVNTDGGSCYLWLD